MTNLPIFDTHTRTVPRDPDLMGILPDGSIIDLDGGRITFHPNQQIQWSDFGRQATCQDGRHEYHLTFSKRPDSPWVKWFNDHLDTRFKVGGFTFMIESAMVNASMDDMLYTARSVS